jgi:putative oxidoreductase
MTWESFTNAVTQWQSLGPLLARLSVGLLFTISGSGKLFVRPQREQMRQTLVAGHIPMPATSTVILSSVEFVCGAFLLVGLLTPLCCIMLAGVMTGALATTIFPRVKGGSVVKWLGEVLYLPETLYVVILLWLLLSGPGVFSLDHTLFLPR